MFCFVFAVVAVVSMSQRPSVDERTSTGSWIPNGVRSGLRTWFTITTTDPSSHQNQTNQTKTKRTNKPTMAKK